MNNHFDNRRPPKLEDKAHAEAIRHFAEHLEPFPASHEAIDRLDLDIVTHVPHGQYQTRMLVAAARLKSPSAHRFLGDRIRLPSEAMLVQTLRPVLVQSRSV
jgi:hypothetical protein